MEQIFRRIVQRLLLALAVGHVIVSCTKEEPTTSHFHLAQDPLVDTHVDQRQETKRERLIKDAVEMYQLVHSSDLRNSQHQPRIKDVIYLTSSGLRSSINSKANDGNVLSIVNFDNNAGFVILSEEEHYNNVLGIASSGRIAIYSMQRLMCSPKS